MNLERQQSLRVGKSCLRGVVTLSGAKNSALKHLTASILTDEVVTLQNYPGDLSDIRIHEGMLRALGKRLVNTSGSSVSIGPLQPLASELCWKDRSIRNTLLILGALTTRTGEGRVPLPGGCDLGNRGYDIHEFVLKTFGADVWRERDFLCAKAPPGGLQGAEIHLPIRSTGATENAILCGVLARGMTRIWNPHIRPEILDLILLLSKMGSNIKVYGQERIEIEGVEYLSGAEHTVASDNMEAVTWLVGAIITNGDVEIRGFPFADMEVVLAHLRASGARLYQGDNSLIARGDACYPLDVSTGPHPGINSDVQPILAAWAARANGESRIIDLRFPGRYAYASEMAKMGVEHEVRGDMLIIRGNGGRLHASRVRATDLRAGAALALCGLIAAGGETEITDAWQISRGYMHFPEKLKALGAEIEY